VSGTAQLGPIGTELQVNTTTIGWQTAPTAAFDSLGNFVAVWQSGGSGLAGTEDTDIFARRFRADGTPLSADLQVNLTVAGCQGGPAVASAPDGSFVVVWQSQGQDGDGWGVFGRRFAKDGSPVGGELAINLATAGDQQAPAVAYDPSGSFFTVAWESQGAGTLGWDVLARQFSAATGNPLAGEVRLNATTAGDQRHPALAALASGTLVVAWEGSDGEGTGIVLRSFSSALAPLTPEVAANVTTAGFQSHPALGCDDSGNCAVAWESSGQDGSASGIVLRRFDRNLSPLSPSELAVNATTAGLQAAPALASFPSGDFVVGWESAGEDSGSSGLFAEPYDFKIQPQGGEIPVNTFVPGDQRRVRLAAAPNGSLLALWESADQDGDGTGIFAQRYALPGWRLYTVTPCRLFDSRASGALSSGVLRTVAATGACGIPASARALSANLTVTGPTGSGNVVLFPADAAAPVASLLNFSTGQTRSNNALLTLARTGTGNLTISPFVFGGGQVQLIVDVNGYFQ
jgi:hypothetical protein